MRNGNDKGLVYWKLNYRAKFIRTLWISLFIIPTIIMMMIADISIQMIIMASVLMFVTSVAQLIYTYVKWKDESKCGESE
ncbi:hypothetical protein [Alkalibacillus haloalkaliphilus]|uniref:hypothetical protein n=1 Tax=Alkalibacillus haloalkaliphilus TaxID=94136 RepID=UPI000382AF80|nr:hypothetical protein [Alkalibacillus haloalkaliphilus]